MLVIWLDTPISSSIHCLLNGMVAELEQVPKAFSAAGRIAFRNFSGLCLPISFTERPYTTIAKPKNATYRMTSCVAREMIVSVPLASTTGTMVQKTPMGVKYMMVVMIFRHTSLTESIRFRNGVPFSPTAISVKPMIRANTRTWSMFPSANAAIGLEGIRFFRVSRILLISVAWISAVAISNLTPSPRWISLGMISPHRLASAVVQRK